MKEIHLIMPMAGGGVRFMENGYKQPKPLIEINQKPFFYWATLSILKDINVKDIHFVVLQEHVDKFRIDKEIKKYFPNSIIKVIPKILKGPVLTCLAGIEEINDNLPILFNDCDHMFRAKKFGELLNNGTLEEDGALLTFVSREPQFSYIQYDQEGNFERTIEKKVVSSHAICGAYYFKNKDVFKNACKEYLKKCEYSEYFMSGVYNIMHENNKIIKDYLLDYHVEFGTPKEYEIAKNSKLFRVLQEEK